MIGITAIGTYLPEARLSRAVMAEAMGWLTPGLPRHGTRTMAFWDEDSTTMALEAARMALAGQVPSVLDFCTVTPAFAERQNGAILHAALGLPPQVSTQEAGATPLSGLIALYRHLEAGTRALIACADRPVCAPGSVSENRAGDGAACVMTGLDAPALIYLGGACRTDPFADRYRMPGQPYATEWEDRWVREVGWQGQVVATIEDALSNAGVDAVNHLVAVGPTPGVAKQVAQTAGLNSALLADDLSSETGHCGTAHPFLALASHLPQIHSGDTILITGLGQGATAMVFRATDVVSSLGTGLDTNRTRARAEASYTKLPVFSGLLTWDPGPRGKTPVMEALTTAQRYAPSLLSFTGGRCRETGAVQFPPSRISANRQAPLMDTQDPWPLADRTGTVATRTADTLAFSRNPPSCYGLVDFDGGGRLMMDFTDAGASDIAVGETVRFVFRVKDIDAVSGYRRYFWKAVSAATTTDNEVEARHAKRA